MRQIVSQLGVLLAVSNFLGCSGMDDSRKGETTLSTPEGEVTLTTSEVEPSPQKITAVGKDDLAEFVRLASLARDFVSLYVSSAPDDIDLATADEAFRLWLADKQKGTYSENDIVSILGAFLGETCCKDLNMEWVTVSDEYGTDYAVRSIEVEALGFPFSTVAKRVEDREAGFLLGVFRALEDTISNGDIKKR